MSGLLTGVLMPLADHWPLIVMMAAVGVLVVIALPNVIILTTFVSMVAGGIVGAGLAIGLLIGFAGGAPATPTPGPPDPALVLALDYRPDAGDSRGLAIAWRLGTGSPTTLVLEARMPLIAQVGRFLQARAGEVTGPLSLDLTSLPAGLAMVFADQAPFYDVYVQSGP